MRSRLSQRTDERKRPRRIDGAVAFLERVTGIEPALSAWKAGVLPLNYTRKGRGDYTPIDSPSKTNPMNTPLSGNIVGSKEIHIADAQPTPVVST